MSRSSIAKRLGRRRSPHVWLYALFYAGLVVASLIFAVTEYSALFPGIVPAAMGRITQASGDGLSSAHVLRISEFPQYHIPPLDRAVTDPAKTQALYAALLALPPMIGTYSCPLDIGVGYHLTFYRGQTQVSWASVDVGGCQEVDLPNGDRRLATDHFWATFANTLGVTMSDVENPQPQLSGPYAPQSDPSQP